MIQYVAAALWNIVSQSILILLLSKCLVLDKDMCVPRSTGVYKKYAWVSIGHHLMIFSITTDVTPSISMDVPPAL